MTKRYRPADRGPVSGNDGPLAVATYDVDHNSLTMISAHQPEDAFLRALVLLRHNRLPLGVEVLDVVDGHLRDPIAAQLSPELLTTVPREVHDEPALSVVICTRGRPQMVAQALADVMPTLGPTDELIVVDNAPTDSRTADVVAGFNGTVRHIVEPVPGLASARNAGLGAAGRPFVAFIDDDITPDPMWLTVIRSTFADNPGAVCVTGSVLPMSLETDAARRFQEFGGCLGDFELARYHMSLHPAPSPTYPFDPRLLGTGANMAFRAEAVQALGGFDPVLGAGTKSRGGEDIDLAVRMLLAGHLLVRQPAAVVWRRAPALTDDLLRQVEDFGCGLGAALTKSLRSPSTAGRVMRRLPAVLHQSFSTTWSTNAPRSSTVVRELRRAELRGMVRGPFAYWAAVRQHRRL